MITKFSTTPLLPLLLALAPLPAAALPLLPLLLLLLLLLAAWPLLVPLAWAATGSRRLDRCRWTCCSCTAAGALQMC